jgi:hypothetical protein
MHASLAMHLLPEAGFPWIFYHKQVFLAGNGEAMSAASKKNDCQGCM